MRPKEVIKKWVEVFNTGNTDEISELYHDDAINHQVANEPIIGRDSINVIFRNDLHRQKWFVLLRTYSRMEIGGY